MIMHNPPHPGEILKQLCLEPLGLTITEAAKALGISRKSLSAIVNGLGRHQPGMAHPVILAFDKRRKSWLNQQVTFDL